MQQAQLRNIFKFIYYRLPYLIVLGSFAFVLLLTSAWMITSTRPPKPGSEMVAKYTINLVEPSSVPVATPEPALEIVGLHDSNSAEVESVEFIKHVGDEPESELLQDLNIAVKSDVKTDILKSSPIAISLLNAEESDVESVKTSTDQLPVEQEQVENINTKPKTIVMEQPVLESRDQILSGSTTDSTYTVQPGDTLWDIAQQQLGDPFAWVELYELNQGVIGSNPDLILPGQVLILP